MEKAFKFNIGGLTNWYDHYIAGDIELIAAYIKQCEISNNYAVSEYYKDYEVEIEENENGHNNRTIHFRGIDGYTFNAENIYVNVFPNMNRHTTLVMVMSMFEKRLKQLCDWVYTHFSLNKPFKMDNRSLLKNVKIYLLNTAKIKFSKKLEERWGELMVLQSIRNNITHNYGEYQYRNNYISEYIENNKNICISKENEFIFTQEFLKDLVPNFNELCKELQIAIREKK